MDNGRWQFKTKVNPQADTVDITTIYIKEAKEEPFVLPAYLSREDRKNYPITLLEEKLERKFNDEMKERILPHIFGIYDNVPAMVRFTMKTTMKNSEGEPRNREVHTLRMEINPGRSSERNRVFQAIKEEWINVQNKFSIHATGERAP